MTIWLEQTFPQRDRAASPGCHQTSVTLQPSAAFAFHSPVLAGKGALSIRRQGITCCYTHTPGKRETNTRQRPLRATHHIRGTQHAPRGKVPAPPALGSRCPAPCAPKPHPKACPAAAPHARAAATQHAPAAADALAPYALHSSRHARGSSGLGASERLGLRTRRCSVLAQVRTVKSSGLQDMG